MPSSRKTVFQEISPELHFGSRELKYGLRQLKTVFHD